LTLLIASSFSQRLPHHPSSTLFPYTTLFRSVDELGVREQVEPVVDALVEGAQQALALGGAALQQLLRLTLALVAEMGDQQVAHLDRKSTRLNSSHVSISYAVFCLKKKIIKTNHILHRTFTPRQLAIQNRVPINIVMIQSIFSLMVLNLYRHNRR